jgi:hypothetical protein
MEMIKEDWIILRLILLAYKCDRYTALNNRDLARSLQHLLRKYGSKQVMDAFKALHEEGAI